MILSAFTFWQRLGVYAAVLLLILAAIWGYGARRYQAGLTKERTIHAAELARINAKGEAQNKASAEREAGWAADYLALKEQYAKLESDSRQARVDRDGRISGLVQNLAGCRIRELSQAPTDPRRIAEATRIAERLRAIGTAFAGVGDAAERDALRLAYCADTLRAERQ